MISIAETLSILERYFDLYFDCIWSAIIINKRHPKFSEIVPLICMFSIFILWVLFNITLLHLASHWGGIRG
jgi:hypothetical protein